MPDSCDKIGADAMLVKGGYDAYEDTCGIGTEDECGDQRLWGGYGDSIIGLYSCGGVYMAPFPGRDVGVR